MFLPEVWIEFMKDREDFQVVYNDCLRRLTELTEDYCPDREDVFRCFEGLHPDDVRVIIMGQDPYTTKENGQCTADGLAFSSRQGSALTPSLNNVSKALEQTGHKLVSNDLTSWRDQGILLINRLLTISRHDGKWIGDEFWAPLTYCIVNELASRAEDTLFICLWGSKAHAFEEYVPVTGHATILKWRHPSPLGNQKVTEASPHFNKCSHFGTISAKYTDINWTNA